MPISCSIAWRETQQMIYTLDSPAQEQKDLQLAAFDDDFAWKLGCLMFQSTFAHS
jgi:uncharacterized protein (UPF0303 family)